MRFRWGGCCFFGWGPSSRLLARLPSRLQAPKAHQSTSRLLAPALVRDSGDPCHTADGCEIHFAPFRNPRESFDSPVNSNEPCPMASKWCEIVVCPSTGNENWNEPGLWSPRKPPVGWRSSFQGFCLAQSQVHGMCVLDAVAVCSFSDL